MKARLDRRNVASKPQESRENPLIALQCVAGGGKSFFLDEFAHKRGRVSDGSTKCPELQPLLDSAIFVNITFNGDQPGTVQMSAAKALAVRLLHS
jgi:hypothetical protein